MTVAVCSLFVSPLLANELWDGSVLFLIAANVFAAFAAEVNADMHIITVHTPHFVYVSAWLSIVDESTEWLG